MSQEIFPAQNDDFEPFVTELTTTAVVGGESLVGRQLMSKQADLEGSGRESFTESKTTLNIDVEVRSDNIISSPENLKSSTTDQRGANSLVTIPDHASGIIANLDFYSNAEHFEAAAKALETAMANSESTTSVAEVLPMEFHWLLSHNTVRSHNYEKALEELNQNGMQCLDEARRLKEQIYPNNLRFQMAGDEQGDKLGDIKAFTLEFMPADLVQIYKGKSIISGRIMYVINQDLLNQLTIQDTKFKVFDRVKVSSVPDKEERLMTNIDGLNKLHKSFNLTQFHTDLKAAIAQDAMKEGIPVEEYLAENTHVNLLLKNLENYSERDRFIRAEAKSIEKNPKKFLGIEEDDSNTLTA